MQHNIRKGRNVMWDLLLTNGIVITVDESHRIYDKGYVAVEGNSIAALGPMEQLPQPPG